MDFGQTINTVYGVSAFLLTSLVETRRTPINLVFFYISPLRSLNLVLIPDAKLDGHRGTWTGCAIVLFNKIFRLIQPFLSDLIYWKGPKHAKNFSSKVRHWRCNTPKKLYQCDEFLLTLMCLRLGLLNQDLAERSGVSPTLFARSNI